MLYIGTIDPHRHQLGSVKLPMTKLYNKQLLRMHRFYHSLESGSSYKDTNLDIEHLINEPIIRRELSFVSSIIVDEFAELISYLPKPSELISMYKNHSQYDGDLHDSDYLNLMLGMYVHHSIRRPEFILKLKKSRHHVVKAINDGAKRAMEELNILKYSRKSEISSYATFLDKLNVEVESMLLKMEFHAVFRLLILDMLVNSWENHSREVYIKDVDFQNKNYN